MIIFGSPVGTFANHVVRVARPVLSAPTRVRRRGQVASVHPGVTDLHRSNARGDPSMSANPDTPRTGPFPQGRPCSSSSTRSKRPLHESWSPPRSDGPPNASHLPPVDRVDFIGVDSTGPKFTVRIPRVAVLVGGNVVGVGPPVALRDRHRTRSRCRIRRRATPTAPYGLSAVRSPTGVARAGSPSATIVVIGSALFRLSEQIVHGGLEYGLAFGLPMSDSL